MRLAQDSKNTTLLQYGLIICLFALLTMGALVLLEFAAPDASGGIRQSRSVLIRLANMDSLTRDHSPVPEPSVSAE
jgi:hypothetical protein